MNGYYPSVPNFPGVPQISRISTNFIAPISILGPIQSAAFNALNFDNIWGIYYADSKSTGNFTQSFINNLLTSLPNIFTNNLINVNKNIAVIADSCISIDSAKQNKVSDYPIQEGTFVTYNKVIRPENPIIRLARGGNTQDKEIFINSIKKLADNTTLVDVVTNGYTFKNCTIEGYRYTRTADKGANLIEIDISLFEVKQIKASFSTSNLSTSINAQSPVNNGIQRPISPNNSQIKKLTNNYVY